MIQLTRRQFLNAGVAGGTSWLLARSLPALADPSTGSGGGKYNVLFIAVDDLRPHAGCYGVSTVKTPNIDALAARGTVFNHAYCQQAVCSPSRTSLLLGRRPDTTKVYDLETHFRANLPDVVTLPQHFKQSGYHSQGFSKIFHGGLDDPQSWSVPHWEPKGRGYGKPETIAAIDEEARRLRAEGVDLSTKIARRDPKTGLALRVVPPRRRARGPAWEDPDVADNALADGITADRAVEALSEMKKDQRFFLAGGFHKPHLPFVAPKRYFDLYSKDKLPLASNPQAPADAPQLALTSWGELRSYKGIPKQGPLTDEQARDLVHAYHAATSYTDAQIGRVLKELDNLGLREKTIVVLWGDHGWHLGEHGLWCKHTNFEIATRSMLVVSAPGQRKAGAKTDALVEFVDIYPTLSDLCGLPLPEGLEGTSFAPLLDTPDRAWKKAAFSQYPRGKAMGYTVRTDRYRYTEWSEPGKDPVGVELYDHQIDPAENTNTAAAAGNKDLTAKLSKMLHDGWRAARP